MFALSLVDWRAVMRIRCRAAQPADLAPSFFAFGDPFAYNAYSSGLAGRVPRIWQSLIAVSAMMVMIFDDLDRPRENRTVGLSASVFVTESFANEAQSYGNPYVRAQL